MRLIAVIACTSLLCGMGANAAAEESESDATGSIARTVIVGKTEAVHLTPLLYGATRAHRR